MADTDHDDNGLPNEIDADPINGSGGDEAVAETSSLLNNPKPSADQNVLQAWVFRVVDRDQEALSALYEHLIGRVYGLALRITRSQPLAEEVAQDTFWQVWRQAPRFDPARGTALSWIMTMARSRALDALRRIETQECGLLPETLECLTTPEHESPVDLLFAIQKGNIIQAALAKLEPLPRQLVALAFFRGFSHDEIAGHAGLPLGTVKSHIRRALDTMRQTMTPDVDLSP
ncbi:MAG: sigma-70 family RNA polymerase sigma factor [Candidatus Methylumidiphilus sp.]